ncbi:MAG: Hsp20 family protein [Alphaproteobacteria bacterium]|nr:Hsp20 family protein [Alphaproteobacteria bacterium]
MSRRLSLFDSPFLLGFDEFERALDRVSRSGSEGYPPYNIEQLSETQLRISIAVAGFDMADLSVQLEQNQLVIRGKRQGEDEGERIFLHRGIATRQFQRSFILSDDIEIASAWLDNGLLHIDLKRLVPETTVQNIPIRNAKDKKDREQQTIDVARD